MSFKPTVRAEAEKFIRAIDAEDVNAMMLLIRNSGLINPNNGLTRYRFLIDSPDDENEYRPAGNSRLLTLRLLLHEGSKKFVTKIFRQAVRNLEYRFANFLLEELPNRIDINEYDSYGVTALHAACRTRSTKIAKLLLDHHADVHLKSMKGSVPFSFDGDYENDWKMSYGKTALHFAVMAGNPELVRLLRAHGADLYATDDSGSTCLHFFHHSTYTYDCALLLLEAGLNANVQNDYAMTPLYIAAKKNMLVCIKLLLQYGADINITCSKCLTPLDVAASRPILEILKNHVIAMEVIEIPVHDRNLEYVDMDGKDRMKFEDCEKELAILAIERIGNSKITFYSFLTGSKDRLLAYGRDENILECLDNVGKLGLIDSDQGESRFPWYNNFILTQFNLLKDRVRETRLINSSLECLDIAFVNLFGKRLPEAVALKVIACYNNEKLEELIRKTYVPSSEDG